MLESCYKKHRDICICILRSPGSLRGPRPWPLPPAPAAILALNLYLPAVVPNLCLPALAPNVYLPVMAPNLYLPTLDPNLYLTAWSPICIYQSRSILLLLPQPLVL